MSVYFLIAYINKTEKNPLLLGDIPNICNTPQHATAQLGHCQEVTQNKLSNIKDLTLHAVTKYICFKCEKYEVQGLNSKM
jgi:hypothetical protein